MKRIPRKKKKTIPNDTPYCYKATSGIIRPKGELPYYHVKRCPFYTNSGYSGYSGYSGHSGYCKLIKCEVIDQVKECGQRLNKKL